MAAQVLRRPGRERRRNSHEAANTARTPTGTAILIASTLERSLEEVPLGEDVGGVAIAELVVELDSVTIEELTMEETGGVLAAEVVDVAGMGGVAVKRAVAAVRNTSLASPLMRVQKSGRRLD